MEVKQNLQYNLCERLKNSVKTMQDSLKFFDKIIPF